MPQWQNFSYQPPINPYQNNYTQPMPIPPMQNPYVDRMNQLQNFQQSLQQPVQQPVSQPQGLVGKVVNDFSEITANDVPMNGISAVFPKADMSEVQLRAWAPNGTIQTITYKPILEQNSEQVVNTPQMDFNALNEDVRALREEILERFDRIEKSMGGSAVKAAGGRARKGEGTDE